MKKTILISLMSGAMLLTSCQPNDSIAQAKDQSMQQLQAAGITNMENDALFAAQAASNNLLQIQLAQAAIDKAVSPEVEELAIELSKDHRQMQSELESLATQMQLVLPTSLGATDQQTFDSVDKESGIAFDLAYIKVMESLHENMLKRYEDMSKNGTSMQIKQYASKQVPLLQVHQQEAAALKALVNKAS